MSTNQHLVAQYKSHLQDLPLFHIRKVTAVANQQMPSITSLFPFTLVYKNPQPLQLSSELLYICQIRYCLIHESLKKANKIFTIYSVEFCSLTVVSIFQNFSFVTSQQVKSLVVYHYDSDTSYNVCIFFVHNTKQFSDTSQMSYNSTKF